jgi:hypothetical protein
MFILGPIWPNKHPQQCCPLVIFHSGTLNKTLLNLHIIHIGFVDFLPKWESKMALKSTFNSHITKSLHVVKWRNFSTCIHNCWCNYVVRNLNYMKTQAKSHVNSNFGFSPYDNIVFNFKCCVHLFSLVTNITPYSCFIPLC